MQEAQFLYLTTKGRNTGKMHEIEIWFVEYDGNCYIVSELGEGSNWVQNIKHDTSISFRAGDKVFKGTARIMADKKTRIIIKSFKVDGQEVRLE
ncbi:MAG TPA: nitroreductase/quinone reductase family protein [Nitrososphaerales archaeon]